MVNISMKENTITIRGKELDLLKAIELKQLLEELLHEGRKGITLSFQGVEHLSGTGYQVLATVGKKFSDLKVVCHDSAIIDSLKQRGLI